METLQGIWAAVLGAASLAPLATFGVVLVAYLAYRQRDRADRRDQWWKRAQWAIDAALDGGDPQRRLAGLKVLVQLIGSDLATAEDADLMSALAVGIRDEEGSSRRGAAVPLPIQGQIVAEADRLVRAAGAKARP
ncbi:hypothetical protein Achl_3863 [Pseudarthrobacter chlorophenolicus A6]|uniref:Uncharacterized protein n=1 Tax=Pseudarthrobacter chlorophenolicus (strain ATCC 700700 / DSM 12829 / CIP 107037 / JCM 12360 / KCTC 9906 / NCIMB 13794 / A6) TaxID=452863 RepID=B8H813_PSECP|nr:hypothetical protein [Pseudarthrobacter chlorophenolicus]ACL41816.1 hypothetical protein Achl_3863 [Pseudarthrobacter chlorophenolicus A6]SDQ58007.1 hypothetical protein SAMN04489738_1610 [Pseudarthrobacter chlorophenolicus]